MSATAAPGSRMVEGPRAEGQPWERAWWKPVKGKMGIFVYLIAIHGLALAGLILFPLPGWRIFLITVLLTAWGGFGTTVCYHRALAHRTVKLNPVIENLLVLGAMLNGSGSPASWVSYHRLHHSHTDLPDDISSPNHGFWWAHMRWLYQTAPADSQRWAPDFQKGIWKFWEMAQVPVILISLFMGFFWGWAGFFWIGAIRLVYSLHGQCLVNSLTHLGQAGEGDRSMNIWWLGPFQLTAWGENWHKNHHSAAGSARLGWRWWQVDIGWYFICLLEAVGLASNVKRLDREKMRRALA